jgi:hypothetical protein
MNKIPKYSESQKSTARERPSRSRKKGRGRPRINHRRLSALILAQLYRVSIYMQEVCGEILDADEWLEVFANILSSAPPGKHYIGRRAEKVQLGLSYHSLAEACVRGRIRATDMQIQQQVEKTTNWRKLLAERAGKPVLFPMKPDTIGRKLGITPPIRNACYAWNLGTYGGSPQDRRQASRERDKLRNRANREAAGAKPRNQSLSQTKPWDAMGISRSSWYRLPPELRNGASSRTDSGANSQVYAGTSSSETVSSDTNRCVRQTRPGPINNNRKQLFSPDRASPSRHDLSRDGA